MKWILFRHAEKALQGYDPDLSLRGLEQSLKIVEKVKKGGLPKPSALYISTKKRTAQTFKPLSEYCGLKVQIRAELTERVPGETREKFRIRIQEFLLKLMLTHQESETIYLCTHYDWIEEFLSIVESDEDITRYTNWPSAQHMVLEKNTLWKLVKFEGI